MFERFSLQSRHVIVEADRQAQYLAAHHIGSEHLFLALLDLELSEASSLAVDSIGRLLVDRGLDREGVTSCVRAATTAGIESAEGGRQLIAPFGELLPLSSLCWQLLRRAWRLAETGGHNAVEPHHLWVSLTTPSPDSGALRALSESGIAAAELRNRAQAVVDQQSLDFQPAIGLARDAGRPDAPAPTARYQQILRAARQAALARGHEFVGVEHLMVAILDDGRSAATASLTNIGVSLERVQVELEALMSNNSGSTE